MLVTSNEFKVIFKSPHFKAGIEIFGDPAVIGRPPFFSAHGSSVIRRGRSRNGRDQRLLKPITADP
jgi:hypothetical protein